MKSSRKQLIASLLTYVITSLIFTNIHFSLPFLTLGACRLATIGVALSARRWGWAVRDPLRRKSMYAFGYYALILSATMYADQKSAEEFHVEAIYVLRSLSPILVAIGEVILARRRFPNLQSCLALLAIFTGSLGYSRSTHVALAQAASHGIFAYRWPLLSLAALSIESLYGKRLVSQYRVSMSVLVSSLTDLLPVTLLAAVHHEFADLASTSVTANSVLWLVFLCIIGVVTKYSQWSCRDQVSATSFAILLATTQTLLFLCLSMRSSQVHRYSVLSLLLALIGAGFYRQAPLRPVSSSTATKLLATEALMQDVFDIEMTLSEVDDDDDGLNEFQSLLSPRPSPRPSPQSVDSVKRRSVI